MFGLGPTELIIILVIVLLIFGAKRLPDIGKGLGGAIREFKAIKKDVTAKEPEEETGPQEESSEKEDSGPSLEAKVGEKLLEQVPIAKKAVHVKKTVDKIKKVVK